MPDPPSSSLLLSIVSAHGRSSELDGEVMRCAGYFEKNYADMKGKKLMSFASIIPVDANPDKRNYKKAHLDAGEQLRNDFFTNFPRVTPTQSLDR